jgi:hypothetical protein
VNAFRQTQFFLLGRKCKSNNSRIAIILQTYEAAIQLMNRLLAVLAIIAGRFGAQFIGYFSRLPKNLRI